MDVSADDVDGSKLCAHREFFVHVSEELGMCSEVEVHTLLAVLKADSLVRFGAGKSDNWTMQFPERALCFPVAW